MSTGPRSGPRSNQAGLISWLLVLLWIDTSHAQIISTQSALPARPISTIAGLPACGASLKGTMYFVTDALAPVALANVAAGGAVQIGVTCNGTQWIVQ